LHDEILAGPSSFVSDSVDLSNPTPARGFSPTLFRWVTSPGPPQGELQLIANFRAVDPVLCDSQKWHSSCWSARVIRRASRSESCRAANSLFPDGFQSSSLWQTCASPIAILRPVLRRAGRLLRWRTVPLTSVTYSCLGLELTGLSHSLQLIANWRHASEMYWAIGGTPDEDACMTARLLTHPIYARLATLAYLAMAALDPANLAIWIRFRSPWALGGWIELFYH
jgi:hypothetical protein